MTRVTTIPSGPERLSSHHKPNLPGNGGRGCSSVCWLYGDSLREAARKAARLGRSASSMTTLNVSRAIRDSPSTLTRSASSLGRW